MKKSIKIISLIIGCFIIILLALTLSINALLSTEKLDDKKLINLDRTVIYYDCNGEIFLEESNGVSITQTQKIPTHTKNAFIAIEDKRFFSHRGIDYRALVRATINNVKSLKIKEGASTISQQLIKNTHLSSEKTISRKLKEIKLTKELEKKYSKDEILEKYLNTIYFGGNCYGITSAAKYYFNKKCEDLNVNESAVLAAIIKAPSNYSPTLNMENCFKRKQLILKEMLKQGFIDQITYEENINRKIELNSNLDNENNQYYNYKTLVQGDVNKILEKSPYKKGEINIRTTYNANAQKIIDDCLKDFSEINCDKSVILISKNGEILAYSSSCGEVYRQLGSLIKPIAVYAPAIENDVINPQTLLLDEKTDFNGYSPSNFNEKYYGYISVNDSLAKSSNVCSVKILNYSGITPSVNALNKVNIKTDESDKNLSLALGATKYGATLKQITCAYNVFLNDGYFVKPTMVDEIKNDNKTFYKKTPVKTRVFSSATTSLMNEMLRNVVNNGTAKKLDNCKQNLYAKTGTVGNKNGNSDAYTVSYNGDYVLGVWFGAKNNEQLFSNEITGGTLPAILSANFWQEFYKDKPLPDKIQDKDILVVSLDKISYEQENKIVLADENTPKRYLINGIFKKTNLPKEQSTRFSKPYVNMPKYSVNNNVIYIELCQIEYVEYKIFKQENGSKILIYDTKDNKKSYSEKLKNSTEYQYIIVPYFYNGKKFFYGDEIFLDKIKMPSEISLGDDWWYDDFN